MVKNKSGNGNHTLLDKMDQLMKTLNENERKADGRHSDVMGRLNEIEHKQKKTDYLLKQQKKNNEKVKSELSFLKTKVNELEQNSLINELIIKGVPSIESGSLLLSEIVISILRKIHPTINEAHIVKAIRVGKPNIEHKPIIVSLTNTDLCTRILQGARKTFLDCSSFSFDDKVMGEKGKRIFISEHLTKMNSHLFWQARQLKRKNLIKYAWTKNCVVYVKKSDDDQAYFIKNQQQLEWVKTKVGATNNETSDESTTSVEFDSAESNDESSLQEVHQSTPKKKRRGTTRKRSPNESSKKSRPKRACQK